MEDGQREINLVNKSSDYYSKLNLNVLGCIKGNDNIILDVGCGYGLTGKALRTSNRAKFIVGVEINPDAAAVARENLDEVLSMNIEDACLNYESHFDYIILSHVLEHLVDPFDVLIALRKTLKNTGKIIVGLPNIRYWRILRDLIFFDAWEYREAGILDYDHKRFFTYSSATELLSKAQYQIVHRWLEIGGPKQKMANALTGNMFKSFLSSEFYIVGSKE
jgi:2-polyprenyl-3-methyl-5-hydroxy-6-metoxy-1,4-benzoquinol methylase